MSPTSPPIEELQRLLGGYGINLGELIEEAILA